MVPGAGGCPRCGGFAQDFLDLLYEESLGLPALRCLNCGARRYFDAVLSTRGYRVPDLEHARAEMRQKLDRERAEREAAIEMITAGLSFESQQVRPDGRDQKKTDDKIEAAKKLSAHGVRRKEAAQILGISIPTLDRWLRV